MIQEADARARAIYEAARAVMQMPQAEPGNEDAALEFKRQARDVIIGLINTPLEDQRQPLNRP